MAEFAASAAAAAVVAVPAAAARGRPSAVIDIAVVEQLLDRSWTMKDVAAVFGVDPVTIRRRLAESGSSYRHHLPDDELLAQLQAVSDIQGQGRADGFRTGQAALMAHAGLRPSRQQVLDVRRAHDPDANEARQERVLRRRPYDVQTAMELWHFDSYEKLHMYGFWIHACIDGGSNFVVYATAALNKSADALLVGFERAVADFGFPLRVRADMALEGQGIGQRMLDVRGAGAYLTGPSTANQRIENWWNWVANHLTWFWRNLFQSLEQRGLLDRFNPEDLFSLTQVYLPVLQQSLCDVTKTWNYHSIRPQASREIRAYVPIQRFEAEQIDFEQASPAELRERLVDTATMPGCVAWTAWELRVLQGANATQGQRRRGPGVQDPLTLESWRLLRDALVRGLLQPSDRSEEHYLFHRMVTHELVQLREYQQRLGLAANDAGYLALPAVPAAHAAAVMHVRQAILQHL